MPDAPSLYLLTPILDEPDGFLDTLAEACRVGTPEAVLLRFAPADERTLVNRLKLAVPVVQASGAAAIVADPGEPTDLASLVSRGGADGAQTGDPARLAEARERLKDGRALGAGGLLTRHDAMEAGEAGVDYVMFGEPDGTGRTPDSGFIRERAEWWAEIFQTPCVAYAACPDSVRDLARTGAEFVAVGDLVWNDPDGPATALGRVRQALAEAGEPVR